ncbi:hypothetical protein [Acidaminobacter hydrogenoformans]|uniref:hypothetical protein n=1 Tax=Acidaminobacter hydrogenoformans TaxID=65403 RepID=UPI001A9A5B4F|nr:hypothetical protein [Acidaminobacter hydrogenoformans]
MKADALKAAFENFKLLLAGTFDFKDNATKRIKKEAMDEMDNFMLLCYGDLLGIPLPTTYYTLELLPYLAEDLEGWERRIMARKSIYGDRWGDFCC